MTESSATTIVVAAVIRDDRGHVLLTRRPDGAHMGGLWEFPGGKVERGERPSEALVRELREELAVDAVVGRPLTFAEHSEPGLSILLLFYEAVVEGGRPIPVEGQKLAWVAPHRLADYPTPPADAALVALLVGLDREQVNDLG